MILRVASQLLLPLLLLFSIFLLVRGHNEPGGGFAGGLVAAAAIVLHAMAAGTAEARRLAAVEPRSLIAAGLAIGLLTSGGPLLLGLPPFQGLWFTDPLPAVGKLGTPLLFDVGVYLVVIGVSLDIVLSLAEES